jgi:hypothetical protein
MTKSSLYRTASSALLLLASLALSACAAYATPGRGADMTTFGMTQNTREVLTDGAVQRKLDLKPLARFPTSLAVVRVQAPGYSSYTCKNAYGQGSYSVITTRDVESDEAIAKLEKLPLVTGVAPVGRLLLPQQLGSDLEVRQAAAALHADLLLVYTIDTTFEGKNACGALSVVSLGLFPTKVDRVTSTASAVLLDTRNGYVYGVAEASAKESQLTNYWGDKAAADSARRSAEKQAFDKLIGDFERAWGGVIRNYAVAGG